LSENQLFKVPLGSENLEDAFLRFFRGKRPGGMSRRRAKFRLRQKQFKGKIEEGFFCFQANLIRPEIIKFNTEKSKDRNIEIVSKERGLPSLALDFFDRQNFEAILAEFDPVDLPEQGLVHRLDNLSQGWILRCRNLREWKEFTRLRNLGEIQTYYKVRVKPEQKFRNQLMEIKKEPFFRDEGSYFWSAKREKEHLFLKVCGEIVHKNKSKMAFSEQENKKKVKKSFFRIHFDEIKNDQFLLDAYLVKGARHQLRLCLSALGLPLIGDPVYGVLPDNEMFLQCQGYFIKERALVLPERLENWAF